MIIIVMGVAGSGKTTVGKLLAESIGFEFLDGDTVHPPANVAKMSAGIPLTDDDRAPWLSALRDRRTDGCDCHRCFAVAPGRR
jgi:gluconokinase